MKAGTRVKFKDDIGTSKGTVFRHTVWWILVEWDRGGEAIVLEQCLEKVL
tara:strand:+ start:267 stop:416 length:150 start_codon:yes stop_codon:yes gene_type:complete